MGTSLVKVRALTDQGTGMEYDMVVLKNRGRDERYPFKFSPLGTLDANVFATEIDDNLVAEFSAEVVAKVGLTIKQNPSWEDVKNDTTGDGLNDTGDYNWATNSALYEIVA